MVRTRQEGAMGKGKGIGTLRTAPRTCPELTRAEGEEGGARWFCGVSRGEVCTVCSDTKLDAELQDGVRGRCGAIPARGATGGAPGGCHVCGAYLVPANLAVQR